MKLMKMKLQKMRMNSPFSETELFSRNEYDLKKSGQMSNVI